MIKSSSYRWSCQVCSRTELASYIRCIRRCEHPNCAQCSSYDLAELGLLEWAVRLDDPSLHPQVSCSPLLGCKVDPHLPSSLQSLRLSLLVEEFLASSSVKKLYTFYRYNCKFHDSLTGVPVTGICVDDICGFTASNRNKISFQKSICVMWGWVNVKTVNYKIKIFNRNYC